MCIRDRFTSWPPTFSMVGYGTASRCTASEMPASAANWASVPISWFPEIFVSVALIMATAPPMIMVANTRSSAITSTLPRSLRTVSRIGFVFMLFLLFRLLRQDRQVVQEVNRELAGTRRRARRHHDVRIRILVHVGHIDGDHFTGHVDLHVHDLLVLGTRLLDHDQVAGIEERAARTDDELGEQIP